MIKSRFCRKNVLILLDDVDDVDQLEALAGSHDWFGAGSRLIITTRDEHLLTKKADVIYGVSLLSRDEAIQLFRRHAYREHKPVDDYEKLSLAVVAYAGGLPLALKILGSFLHDKDKNEWMSALAKLKEIPNARIMDKLKISYDGLQPDEKELFLDIACFFRGRNKDEAMHMLEACGFHPVIGIKVLIQKTLITVLDGKFDMHDLVQEMGHYIVRGDHPNNPEKHSRVWKEQDVINICTMTTMTENDKIEAFVHDRHMHGFSVDLAKVVANMKNLRLLSCHSTGCFPTNFQPKKLCYLKVQYFHGFERQLWEDLTHLPTLKVIDFSSSSFHMTPSFSGLPNLERLTLCNCDGLKDIDPSIGHLERLVYLNLKGCSSLKMIPPFIRAKKLETLILSRCDKLGEFPKIQQNMNSLKYLHLDETEIEVLPSYVGKYCTSLIFLNLSYCFALKSIEFDLYLLEHLEVLDFSGDTELCELPVDPINVECSLEEISQPYNSIKHMRLQFFQRGLVGLEFHHLPSLLRKLNLRNCSLGDGDIDFEFWELSNLEELDLGGNHFSCLQFSLLRLNRLKLLNVSFCRRLVELSELPSSIAVLRADSCSSLERVGDISKCKWLWKVSLKGCNKQGLVGGDIVLTSLLQGNAVEHHFLSLALPGHNIRKGFVPWLVNEKTFTLHLPSNWYDDFVGFLVCTVTNSYYDPYIMITVKHQMGEDSQTEFWQESTKAETDCYATTFVGYVSFSSLRHTAWWNSSHNLLSFTVGGVDKFGVGLFPRKSKCDAAQTRDMVTHCSEFWDEEIKDKNTFTIKHDSESSIEILWHP